MPGDHRKTGEDDAGETPRSDLPTQTSSRSGSGGTPHPTQIGPYRILEKIGEGGFGEVYAAEQSEPVKRRVAVKIIKAGMDTKAVLARFEAERQAIALMDHPNIAKVLDAGETELGRPYFAMELIRGERITKYCDRQRLTTSDRLDLFTQVCQAIQHAHTKGVIHRDVKPSNILVTTVDGRPVPKVIDFGVAKAMAQPLTEKTLFTLQGQIIGTPAYMSPEQAEMTGLGVDTRTDVYSLGVLLYELLTGTLPFETKSLLEAGLDAMRRIIREKDPPSPSTRISSLGDSATTAATQRRTGPKRLTNLVRGELDWITMRALEKDPARRYQSAIALAEDLERHQRGEAVLAGPPSATYQLKKLVSRHKLPVAFAATVLALLVGFGISMNVLRVESELARDAAEAAQAEAQTRAEELELVTEFQTSMLSGIDVERMGEALVADLDARIRASLEGEGVPPEEVESSLAAFDRTLRRANVTDVALELLDEHVLRRAVKAIEEEFSEQPLLQAELQRTVAETYRELGRFPPAVELQGAALETRRRVLGDDHPRTLTAISDLGSLLESMGKLDEALVQLRQALEGNRRVLGDDHPHTLGSLGNIGLVLHSMGRFDEALVHYREAVESSRRLRGDDDPQTLILIGNMGRVFKSMGKFDEALGYYVEALDGKRRVLGHDHLETLIAINNMGGLLLEMGKLDEALGHYIEALDGNRRVLGDDHPLTLTSINNLGGLLDDMERFDEALVYLREALEGRRRILGEDHPRTLTSLNNMSGLLRSMGKFDEALPYANEALTRRRRVLGDDHPSTLTATNNLGLLLRKMGRTDEAFVLYRDALEGRRRVLGNEHPRTLNSIYNMGYVLMSMGKLDEALPYYVEAMEGNRRVRGNDDPRTLSSINSLGWLLASMGKLDEALVHYGKALEGRRRALGDDNPNTLISIYGKGGLLVDVGRTQEAIALLEPAEAAARRAFTGGKVRRLGYFLRTLGRSRSATGSFGAAETNLNEAVAILSEAENVKTKDREKALTSLIKLYDTWHAAEPGAGHDVKAAEWGAKLKEAGRHRDFNARNPEPARSPGSQGP